MCLCQSGPQTKTANALVTESKVRNMAKMVNFEGKMVPYDTLPHGCLFIRGVWYASENALPDEMKTQYGKLFAQMALSAPKTPTAKLTKIKKAEESTKKAADTTERVNKAQDIPDGVGPANKTSGETSGETTQTEKIGE